MALGDGLNRHNGSTGAQASRTKKAGSVKQTGLFLTGALAVGTAFAATVWMVATVLTMQTVAGSWSSDRSSRLETSLGLKAIPRAENQQRVVRLAKFSRLAPQLIALNIKAKATPHRAVAAFASGLPVTAMLKAKPAVLVAEAGPATDGLITGSVPAVMGNGLVEDVKIAEAGPTKPFNLVLSDDAAAAGLPDLGPLPLARPGGLTAAVRQAQTQKDPAKRTTATELAYARPDAPIADDDADDIVRPSFTGRKGVAYYDISAGVVHMPNGEKLEAHSGIGKMRDNPDFVHVTMKGPTPPGTYKVTMRESLFHGVEAVRLTPIDGVAPHGRVGLLAHSYLLRKRGDSHGCVAFANYPKFLKAFKRGEISQMVIVKSMKGGFSTPRKTLASLFSQRG